MHNKMKSTSLGFLSVVLLISIAISGCNLSIFADRDDKESTRGWQTQSQSESVYSADFDTFAYEVFVFLAKDNMLYLNSWIKDPSEFGIEEADSYWPTLSPEHIEAKYDQMQEILTHMLSFDQSRLSREQMVTFEYLSFYLEGELSVRDYYLLYDPLSYYSGKHNSIDFYLSTFSIRERKDIDDYFNMIENIDEYIQGIVDFQFARSEAGYFMNSDHAQRVINACYASINNVEALFVHDFERRIDSYEWLTNAEKEDYKEKNILYVDRYIIPAYKKIIQVMTDLKDTGERGWGLSRFEGGKEYYTRQVQRMTGTERSIDEIFYTLERTLLRWEKRYTYLNHRISIETFYHIYFPYTTADAVIENNLQNMQGRFPMLNNVPEAYYEVYDVPEAFEGGIAGMYLYAPFDDPWTNILYVSQRYSEGLELYEVVSHEAIPGHLYQTVYFITSEPSNMELRYWLSAINESLATLEGWTTYIEGVSHGMAGLSAEEIEYISLHGGIYMLCMSIIDIGMHYYGWSRQDVVNYFRDRTAKDFFDIDDSVFNEIESDPAQYIAYVLGYIDVLEMREQAQETLGDHFSEYEFHKFYLDMGMCTMDTMKREFEHWLDEQVLIDQNAA